MKKGLFFLFWITLSGVHVFSQVNDSNHVVSAVLDYADGYYSGNYERIAGVLHPDFNKVLVYKIPQTGDTFLDYATVSNLVGYTKANTGFVAPDNRQIDTEIFYQDSMVAVVKLRSAKFNDFLHLVKLDTNWKIVNVLWSMNQNQTTGDQAPVFKPEETQDIVKALIKNLVDAQYKGEADRIDPVLHDEMSQASINRIAQTGEFTIRRFGKSYMTAMAGVMKMRGSGEIPRIEISEVVFQNSMAIVHYSSPRGMKFFQLQHIDGNWTIINILEVPKFQS